MDQSLRKYLTQLLVEDRLKELLEVLKDYDFLLSKKTRSEIVLIAGRYAQLGKQERSGTIGIEENNLERNRIRESLLQLLEEISEEIDLDPGRIRKRRIKRIIALAWLMVYILGALGLFWYLIQPQRRFRVEGKILTESVSFRHLDGRYDLGNKSVSALHLYNYQALAATGNEVGLDEQMNGQLDSEATLEDGSLSLRPDPDIAGIGVNFGAIIIERLPIAPGDLVTWTCPRQAGDPFKLQIQQDQSSRIRLNYIDSIQMVVEQAELKYSGQEVFLSGPSFLKLFTQESGAGEITCTTFPGVLSLDLFLKDSFAMQSQGLLVSEPSFYEPVEQVAVPAILSGELSIREKSHEPLEQIRLEAGETLNILGAASLSLDQLLLNQNGIFLTFHGEVSAIETGRNEELRNPSRMAWVWHNHKWALIGILIILVGLFALVMIFLRR